MGLLRLYKNRFCTLATIYIHEPIPTRSILSHDAVHATNVDLPLSSHEADILTRSHRHDHILQAIHCLLSLLGKIGRGHNVRILDIIQGASKQASIHHVDGKNAPKILAVVNAVDIEISHLHGLFPLGFL